MKRVKNYLALMGTFLALTGTLAGCGGNGKEPETEKVSIEEQTQKKSEDIIQKSENGISETDGVEGETEEVLSETAVMETEAVLSETEEKSPETEGVLNQQMYGDYAELVEKYQNAYEQVKNSGVPEEIPEDMSLEFYLAVSYQEAAFSGFQLYDLNEDGVPELFIGMHSGGDASDLFIYDVYTWKDGRSVRLMDDIGYRAGTCIICEGGVIKDLSSSSAVDSMEDYHQLPEYGTELELVESISIHGNIETGEIYYYHDRDGNEENKISEEMYNEISDSYHEIEGILSYESTSENIEALRTGSLQSF
ncbi:hypothetical protein AALA00_08785 [Lachnospiraceae bacterium 46-15]